MPSVREVMRDARKDAEDSEEPRYEGAYVAKEVGLVDTRPIIDKKCHANRTNPKNPNPSPNCSPNAGPRPDHVPRQLQECVGGV